MSHASRTSARPRGSDRHPGAIWRAREQSRAPRTATGCPDCASRGGRSCWPRSCCSRQPMGDACGKAPRDHTKRQASRKSGGRATDGSHRLQPPFPRPRGPQQKSKCSRGAGLCERARNERQASQAMQLRVPACGAPHDQLSKEALSSVANPRRIIADYPD